ncbi:uncharacterized protein MONOS_7260 [Monocercomonoides exilis]|uniref:uncharacterized protein n=1 Tax=Monocercomonoides exilis TaxID=2049356 RepID=UPI00355A88F7|nr:hypothetical protein MONOS_7260 [Monocercomonoides exilis]|eukprot:MONOS_7260.1-p1 / transcript=MONOS_7260.1 / gene=MONOS_7260 / organism=Monocercomonoides_exilis_PA203 / gene_product=unspecified product / transcript_product=unspecified product / location=Mono_scaffold00244:14315-15746(+) / protein_length=348 / sequence_SO=supercontig / SO=protein_coding / is_pseudo=false
MALLALSSINKYDHIEKGLYLKGMIEIIKYHQEHHNLTRLGYQSAWQFLISRLYYDDSLERLIVNELHFVEEAARELEGLKRCIDWKGKEEEEAKEELLISRWFVIIICYSQIVQMQNDECNKLTRSIIGLCRAAKGSHRRILRKFHSFLCNIILREAESSDCFLCEEAVDFILEEMHQPTIDDELLTSGRIAFLIAFFFFFFFFVFFFIDFIERSAPACFTIPEAEKRREEGNMRRKPSSSSSSSSSPAIDPSDASAVAASYTSTGAMDDIERRLRIVVPEAAGVYGRHIPLSLQLLLSPRALQTLRGYVVARRAVLYGCVVCAYDVVLSAMLSVPLVALLPSLAV